VGLMQRVMMVLAGVVQLVVATSPPQGVVLVVVVVPAGGENHEGLCKQGAGVVWVGCYRRGMCVCLGVGCQCACGVWQCWVPGLV
jgi:hypothetical protein